MKKQLLFLTGMMGSGKTTLGKLLARELKWRFADTDALVEKWAGMKVAAIFRKQGEARFRALESLALQQACGLSPCVVATGGGLPLKAANRRLMRQRGLTVHLKAPLTVILKRLGGKGVKKRPLLSAGPKALSVLAKERKKAYEQADLTVNAGLAPKRVVLRVLQQIEKKKPGFCLPKQGRLDT